MCGLMATEMQARGKSSLLVMEVAVNVSGNALAIRDNTKDQHICM